MAGRKSPVIGVAPLYDEKKNSIWMIPGYLDAVADAGGLPLVLPFGLTEDDMSRICGMCDGFLITGGQDVDPALYGEPRSPACGEPYPPRDELDILLLRAAAERDMPVLGICRGLQIMNVVFGGSLWQDIPSEYATDIRHAMTPPYDRTVHAVSVVRGSPLADMFRADRLDVNSYHHQAVKELAPALRAAAVSDDGLVEAAFLPSARFFIGVQWHPELRRDRFSRALFEAFILG